MSSSAPPSVEQKTATPPPPRRSPVKWLIGALAAAVVVVAAVASAVLWFGEDDDSTTTATEQTPAASAGAGESPQTPRAQPSAASSGAAQTGKPLELTVRPQQGRCLLPSADRLKSGAALAFEGTVAQVDAASNTAVIDVSNWLYADGFGGTDTVRVSLPPTSTEATPTFSTGHTYLVAATGESDVMGCGFSGEKTPDLSSLYSAAFK